MQRGMQCSKRVVVAPARSERREGDARPQNDKSFNSCPWFEVKSVEYTARTKTEHRKPRSNAPPPRTVLSLTLAS